MTLKAEKSISEAERLLNRTYVIHFCACVTALRHVMYAIWHTVTALSSVIMNTRCSRDFSQRAARFGNKLQSETETLSDDATKLVNDVGKAIEVARTKGPQSSIDMEEMMHLECAKSILQGNGPGGDL